MTNTHPSIDAALQVISAGACPQDAKRMQEFLGHMFQFARTTSTRRLSSPLPESAEALAGDLVGLDEDDAVQVTHDLVRARDLREYLSFEAVRTLSALMSPGRLRLDRLQTASALAGRKPAIVLTCELDEEGLTVYWTPRLDATGESDFHETTPGDRVVAHVRDRDVEFEPGQFTGKLPAAHTSLGMLCGALEDGLNQLVTTLSCVFDVELGAWPQFTDEGFLDLLDADQRACDFMEELQLESHAELAQALTELNAHCLALGLAGISEFHALVREGGLQQRLAGCAGKRPENLRGLMESHERVMGETALSAWLSEGCEQIEAAWEGRESVAQTFVY